MEFDATVQGERYHFSSLNQNLFLVSSPRTEYLLYNNDRNWKCADEIEDQLLQNLGTAINERLQAPHRR